MTTSHYILQLNSTAIAAYVTAEFGTDTCPARTQLELHAAKRKWVTVAYCPSLPILATAACRIGQLIGRDSALFARARRSHSNTRTLLPFDYRRPKQ